MFCLILVASELACSSPLMLDPVGDEFQVQFDFLVRQDMRSTGRDALVKSVETFIRKHANDPRVAEAMIYLASAYEVIDPGKIDRDEKKSLEWIERAAATAPKGTPLWVKAQQFWVNRIWYSDPTKARTILADIGRTVPNDTLALARAEQTHMQLAIREKNYDVATGHCQNILRWYSNAKRIPSDPQIKFELDGEILAAGPALITAIQNSRLSTRERRERIESLVRDFGFYRQLEQAGAQALDELKGEPERRPDEPPAAPQNNATSVVRRLWIAGGGVVFGVAALGIFWVRRRKQQEVTV